MVKFKAYVTVTIPVEVSVDDKWKEMEKYGNTLPGKITEEQDDYYFDNANEFANVILKQLNQLGYQNGNLEQVFTMNGNNVYDIDLM